VENPDPDQCGKCGSANIRKEMVNVDARFEGHFDEDGLPAEPEFAPPLPVSFEVAEWSCADCGATLLDIEAINKRIEAQISKAIAELN
jgi:hypothetical protein